MSDFEVICAQVKDFSNKIATMKKSKAGLYSAKLELPQWQADGKDFATELSAQAGRFTGRVTLLQTSEQVPVNNSQKVLTDLTKQITTSLEFYAKNWGNSRDKEFCDKLQQGLQTFASAVTAYSRPDAPRPNKP